MPHFAMPILNSFAMVLEKLANLLYHVWPEPWEVISENAGKSTLSWHKEQKISDFYKDVLGAQDISKVLQGDGFLWPRTLFFPILE